MPQVGQWIELTAFGTAKVIMVSPTGSFIVRLGDGSEVSGLRVEHIRIDHMNILSRIEAL